MSSLYLIISFTTFVSFPAWYKVLIFQDPILRVLLVLRIFNLAGPDAVSQLDIIGSDRAVSPAEELEVVCTQLSTVRSSAVECMVGVFVTKFFSGIRQLTLCPTPNLEDQG